MAGLYTNSIKCVPNSELPHGFQFKAYWWGNGWSLLRQYKQEVEAMRSSRSAADV